MNTIRSQECKSGAHVLRPRRHRIPPLAAADQLWANTGLKPAEFSTPVLGLIFLRYAVCAMKHGRMLLANSEQRGLLGAVAFVVELGAIRRPLGLPASGVHDALPMK